MSNDLKSKPDSVNVSFSSAAESRDPLIVLPSGFLSGTGTLQKNDAPFLRIRFISDTDAAVSGKN